jgi:hypothetical protein
LKRITLALTIAALFLLSACGALPGGTPPDGAPIGSISESGAPATNSDETSLTVYFIDVGQADAALVLTGGATSFITLSFLDASVLTGDFDLRVELITNGKVMGYEGQHMKSATQYPDYAGDPNNIQLLKGRNMDINEHLLAHNGNYSNPTNGYYNPENGVLTDFGDGPPTNPKITP